MKFNISCNLLYRIIQHATSETYIRIFILGYREARISSNPSWHTDPMYVTCVILCIYWFIEYVQKQPHTESKNLIRYSTRIGRLLLAIFQGSIRHEKLHYM